MVFWNQSKTFNETLEDFEVTLAQFLIEEKIFPVSFRSGWHYMDNDWQNYLDDRVLPYSMHNDYPAKRTEDPEPIDNIFDWSQAPSSFLPYRPDRNNYQIPGDGSGWQVRSASLYKARIYDLMDTVFAAADHGADQVACFWSHLPESDFPEQMQMIDSMAHSSASKYPGVNFQYCTAIEAMQLWRGCTDSDAPNLNISEETVGEAIYFNITSDETIFQKQPFVAVKTLYEEYSVLECNQTGINQWKSTVPLNKNTLATVAVTACDTMGNQAMEFLKYLPDDTYIDNQDGGYTELFGNWSTSPKNSWGTDSRMVVLEEEDSAAVSWTYHVSHSGYYNIFIQFPDIKNRAEELTFLVTTNQQTLDTVIINELLPAKSWNYLSSIQIEQGSQIRVEMYAAGTGQDGKILIADVLKISSLVRDKNIDFLEDMIDFGQVSVEDSVTYIFKISNLGINQLNISDIRTTKKLVRANIPIPTSIPPMSTIAVPLSFMAMDKGIYVDTLEIFSDDPRDPLVKLLVSADVKPYFHTIDNEDSDQYEEFGNWYTSVATIYGPTSRYTWLNAAPLASARFYTNLKKSGTYEILEIVPSTVNSTDDALYEVYIGEELKTTYRIDQNRGSGDWVSLGSLYLPADTEIALWIKDSGKSTTGAVIRTDAVRFQLLEENTGIDTQHSDNLSKTFRLNQNYPNPFNPKTIIEFSLPVAEQVTLEIFNTSGQKVQTLLNKKMTAGNYTIEFNAGHLSSGMYFYKLNAGKYEQLRKMILLK
jgi:hypothetical protein